MAANVSDKGVREVLDIVRTMIEKFGPRIAGTPECRMSAAEIERLLAPVCDAVGHERFTLHPGSMWNLGHVIGGCYIVAAALMVLGGPWVWGAAAVNMLSFAYWVCQSVFMVGAFDFLYQAAEGINVWGAIEPAGEVRRQIYIVGHHDSARVLTFLTYLQKWYGVRIIGAIAFSVAQLISAWAWIGWRAAHGADPAWGWVAAGVGIAGLVFLGPFLFFVGRRGSPGAGDNMVASAMGIGVARIVRGRGGKGRLRHTRLVVLSVDGEEIGLRGARAFIRAHRRELLDTKTYVLNFDAIYRYEDLRLITADRNGFEPLSAEMRGECKKVAERLGHTIAEGPVTFGGGGTDAAEFAAGGIEVASIIGISTRLVREGLVYHTVEDTVDHIEPPAVKACMEIAVNYIREKDGE